MTDGKTKPEAKKTYDKQKIFIYAICLVLIAGGMFYFWHKNTEKQQSNLEIPSAVATVDVDKLLPEHENYNKLLKLQAEKMLIINKLKSYMIDDKSNQTEEINPAADVFTQVVEQQDNLRNIKMRQQLKEESAVEENRIRNELSAEKNSIVQKINDKYYNAILNITIKLDNADNLRLSQDEQNSLLEQLDYLKRQRGNAVYQVEQKFNTRVINELMAWRTQREKELGINNVNAHQMDVTDSNEKLQAEKERNESYLKDRMEMMKAKKNDSQRLLVLLNTKDNEINLLKKSMLKDIASKATKIAVQKHLKLVIANTPISLSFFGDSNMNVFSDKFLNGIVVGVDSVDITDDILNEMKSDKK